MVTKRKNSTRTGWDSVVERLSRKAPGGAKKEAGDGHPVTVDGGKPGRSGRVGSNLELTLHLQMSQQRIAGYVMEHKFHPTRRWRFDFCWPQEKIALRLRVGLGVVDGIPPAADSKKTARNTIMLRGWGSVSSDSRGTWLRVVKR